MEKRVNLLKIGSRYLAKEGVVNPSRESEIFLSHILNCSRIELYLDNLAVEERKLQHFWRLLTERAKGLPLQYILGSTEFMGLEFKVKPGVFIPRPETEILVETTIDILTKQRTNEQTILDIGTGCGNIAISFAKYFKDAHIFACDISDFALQLAKGNSYLNQVGISLVKSDLFGAFKKENYFSLILSNPPYVSAPELTGVSREVHYEPRLALEAGIDGLFYYRRIINQAPAYLQDNGLLALEIGDRQADSVKEIFRHSGNLLVVKVVKDYNDVERVIVARKRVDNG